MIGAFTFHADDRTFDCAIETSRGGTAWWWFTVTGDKQRYAPFQPAKDDTAQKVADRILAYYRDLIVRRETRFEPRAAWQRPRQDTAPAAKTSTV